MRRLVAWTTVLALVLGGCSRAAEIPREQVTAEDYRKPGSYRIRLHGWNAYYARRFSMTDSTVVIEELLTWDDHFELMRDEMPIVIPLKDVENISVMKTNWLMTAVAVVAIGAVAGLIEALGHFGPFGQ
jgi:hypothetical protein